MAKIKVLIKEPGKLARFEKIENSIEEFQRIIGGYIESISIASDLVILCDEDGKMKGLAPSVIVGALEIVGTVIFVGKKNQRFTNIPLNRADLENTFPHLFRR